MMSGVTVLDQGQGSNGDLRVVSEIPSALIFKDRLYGELKANIFGDAAMWTTGGEFEGVVQALPEI